MWRLNGSVGRVSGGVGSVGWDVVEDRVLICIQVLYVLGQPSVHHTYVCANPHMYVSMCMYQSTCTYTHYTQI